MVCRFFGFCSLCVCFFLNWGHMFACVVLVLLFFLVDFFMFVWHVDAVLCVGSGFGFFVGAVV